MSLEVLARRLQRQIQLARRCSRLPPRLAYRGLASVLPVLGGMLSKPAAEEKATFRRWYVAHHAHHPAGLARAWQAVKTCHAAYLINACWHARQLSRIASQVRQRSDIWHDMVNEPEGALILTMHHDFHHTLFTLTGQSGRPVSVLAAPEESSPLAPWMAATIRQYHRDCAVHFNGGDYLFLDQQYASTVAVRKAFHDKHLIFALLDVGAAPRARSAEAVLFGHMLNVPSGALDLAIKLKKPVYFAAMVWRHDKQTFALHAEKIEHDGTNAIVLYTQAIERLIRQYPWLWKGWQYVESFPRV